MYSIDQEYALLEELSFIRVGGTSDELKAANIIQKHLSALGLASNLEYFDVNMGDNIEASLEVLEPYYKEYTCKGFMNCKDTDGIEAEFKYVEQYNEVSLKEIEDKIILVNGYVGTLAYDKFIKHHPKAFIAFNGNIDFKDGYDLASRELRKPLNDAEIIPAVNILVEDAMELVLKKASKVKIKVKQNHFEGKSCNVVCDIKGYEGKKTICLTAHYDSVPHSKGVYDNATGVVSLYSMAEYFSKHQPRHNLRLIFTGSEERGLLGSKAYIEAHKDELQDIALNINVDMIGSILGKQILVCTADNSLVHFLDYYMQIKGYSTKVSQGVYSSDSTPFADGGIPAVSFARETPNGAGDIHSRYDVIEHLSKDRLKEDTDTLLNLCDLFLNSYIIPVVREMPKNMIDEINEYLGRK